MSRIIFKAFNFEGAIFDDSWICKIPSLWPALNTTLLLEWSVL
eukprot:10919.XXX_206953_207081_1 [CDS] Oithona nana genome sequencing.